VTAAAAAPVAAIINDDETYQDMWSIQVEEAGYQPYIVHRPSGRAFASVEELANEVENHAQYAVFDHRLAQRDMAQFTGAEIVAALYERRRTAPLLVTTFEKIDKDTTIRLYRRKVPVLLSSADFDNPDTIRDSFNVCGREIWKDDIPVERRAWRTLVQIEDHDTDSKIQTVDVLVPGWDPETKVRFPLDLMPANLRNQAIPGKRFFARVNIGALREEDLFFTDFELALDPDSNDGLA
jgi:hypothetical protein